MTAGSSGRGPTTRPSSTAPTAASRIESALRASAPASRTRRSAASSVSATVPPNPRASAMARATRTRTSSSESGWRVSSRERDNSGALTEKLGFSVVAATRVSQRFSTLGSSTSCCDFENRCTSSTKSTVSASPVARRRRASSITSRTSLTPAVTADSSTKRRPEVSAMRYARVVLPVPGGPHSTTDDGAAGPGSPLTGASNRRNGDPGSSRCRCPTTSSSVRGRIRTASGAPGRTSGSPCGPVPQASKRSMPRAYATARPPAAVTLPSRNGQICDIGPVFEHLGRLIARHPELIVGTWLVLAIGAFTIASVGVDGTSLFDRLSTGEVRVAGSESDQAQKLLASDEQGASLTLAAEGIAPDTAGLSDLLKKARTDLAQIDGVETVIDPLALPGGLASPLAGPLLSENGQGFLVVVDLKPGLSSHAESVGLARVKTRLDTLRNDLAGLEPGAGGIVGGNSLIVSAITGQIERDLTTGEAVALPIALLVMVLVFGGFLAASMPMVGALASIAGGLGLLYGFAHVVDLDSSVVNVVTLLGLGLSIDYGLLIVSRYREELHHLVSADERRLVRRRRGDGVVVHALVNTIKTAGRTVTFSALTVAIAVAGLMVCRPSIRRAIGVAWVSVVLLALLTALTLVPAVLVLAGRLDRVHQRMHDHAVTTPPPYQPPLIRADQVVQLLAVPRDDQEPVVDREAETQQRHDIDHARVEVDDVREAVEQTEAPCDRGERTDHWHASGEEAAADEHQHEQGDRQRHRLTGGEVALDLTGDRRHDQGVPADDAAGARLETGEVVPQRVESRLDPRQPDALGVRGEPGLEIDDDEEPLSVLGKQRSGEWTREATRKRERIDDGLDPVDLGEVGAGLLEQVAEARGIRRNSLGGEGQRGALLVAREQLLSLVALRAGDPHFPGGEPVEEAGAVL